MVDGSGWKWAAIYQLQTINYQLKNREGRAPARPLPRCRFRSRQARPSRAGQRSQRTATLPRRPTVAEDCDPPATRGDGALAIVSACQLPRRRGRTPLATACAAHFVRRICRYYPLPTANYQLSTILYQLHFYTSTRPFSRRRGRRRYCQLPTTNYQLLNS